VTRKLILLDIALLAALAALAWQMHREWIEAHARTQALLSVRIEPRPENRLVPLPKVAPLAPAAYVEVAQMDLFSKDRNPQVVVEQEPEKVKPVPAFPVARGVLLWEGTPPTILLAARSGAPQRAYRAGDRIGEWTVVSIDNQFVVFSWEGQEFKKRIDEIMDRGAQVAEVAQPAAASTPTPAAPAKSQSKSLGGGDTSPKGPGVDVGASDVRMCDPADDSPAGTIQDGFKKVITATPFNPKSCRWEQVK